MFKFLFKLLFIVLVFAAGYVVSYMNLLPQINEFLQQIPFLNK